MTALTDFDGRVLVATGGASGIGREVVLEFVRRGGRAAIADINQDGARDVASRLEGCAAYGVDVSDASDVAAFYERVEQDFGQIDALFLGAGHVVLGPIEEWEDDELQRMVAVHLGGTILMTKYAVPHLKARASGAIVNVSSIAATVTQPFNAPYGAAKAGIEGFTRQMARDLAPAIRVNAIAPGRTLTGMTKAHVEEQSVAHGGAIRDGRGLSNLQGRFAAPEEVAAAAIFLLSDDASFITGHTLVVDGGEVIA